MATRTELSIPARLGIYGATLIGVFLLAYILAGALVPSDFVDRWHDQAHHGQAGATDVRTTFAEFPARTDLVPAGQPVHLDLEGRGR